MDEARSTLKLRIAADVGGTFTDVATFDEATSELSFGKTLTTPAHLVEGISDGVAKADAHFADSSLFLHGTTVAINTMLERTGARTALITTRGFRDVYEIGRINRPDAYNLFFKKHKPLVERALRFEVTERLNALGEVIRPLDMIELAQIVPRLEAEGIEALAILFFHSYRNPAHEIAAKRFFEEHLPGRFITASHEVSNEYREFERTSTVSANAYIGPRVKAYLGEISDHLEAARFKGRFLIVQSTGGLYGANQAERECIRMLESGPAAGIIGTKALCDAISLPNAIGFDMGGTTAKAGVIRNGQPLMAGSVMVGGYNEGLPIQVPMIDIREVGTGGGSIARVGAGGSLRVGPESSGAVPGPACYGRGGIEPTVTDANLVLGRLAADRFLGGDLKLDFEAAREAILKKVAEPLGFTLEQAAEGIIRIATSTMSNVVTRVTTERGLDPADFAMVAFGGAGPLHAALVARELQISEVIIPNAPGHFSAFGMLIADLRRDFSRTVLVPLAKAPFDQFDRIFEEMIIEGTREVQGASSKAVTIEVQCGADMRYVGQEHAVTVDLPRDLFVKRDIAGIKEHFDRVHVEHYGYSNPMEQADIVTLRCAVVGIIAKPNFGGVVKGGREPDAASLRGKRLVYYGAGQTLDTPTYDRLKLKAGNRIEGPALIEEYASTTVLLPGDTIEVDDFGNLMMKVNHR